MADVVRLLRRSGIPSRLFQVHLTGSDGEENRRRMQHGALAFFQPGPRRLQVLFALTALLLALLQIRFHLLLFGPQPRQAFLHLR